MDRLYSLPPYVQSGEHHITFNCYSVSDIMEAAIGLCLCCWHDGRKQKEGEYVQTSYSLVLDER